MNLYSQKKTCMSSRYFNKKKTVARSISKLFAQLNKTLMSMHIPLNIN